MKMSTSTSERTLPEFAQKLVDIRRHLHQNPELSHEEIQTTAAIRAWLTEADIRIANFPLKTGLIAEVGGKQPGPIIAIRADIDALPIQEETGFAYASLVAGKMHACGHDFHTAAVLGAAFLLKERESELKGTIRFVFQPAEEKAQGAEQVIKSGALDGVRAIYGMHNKPDLPVGTIGIKSGPLMAAADGFVIEVEGLGTHAAVPEAGIDPIVTGAHIVTALQSIVSRNISSLQSAVISVTRIHSGTAWNVIPDKAILDGTLRTFEESVRSLIIKRFEQVVHGVAAAYGTKAVVRWVKGPPSVFNDSELALLATDAAREAGLEVITPSPSPAGEDFAFYQKKIPGVFVFMGTEGSQEWHHPAFDLDERALPISANYFAVLAEKALKELSSDIPLEVSP
ncbi:M20 peptidase aminoacylase family protein [Paenibacillus sp. HWE-109]|uniref:M20 peptidase aminoacylase family protein n=1 Tax=Paenibacillus sp. HWE-109 TaxID=1306526 RepID=UPI001EDEFAC8|nr:M20 peptidase aminoacylase family protein [Paenibacillus sp. HWE-109]UKS26447.1 M20 peptidase aminoacylase family protein [Paenibacillus sp. HWE-109]